MNRLWRDQAAYRDLSQTDRSGIMWEWLRRDRDYIAWHARATANTRGTDFTVSADLSAWGLHFRRRP
jgi:hypothetical protein